jgi:hypothetical protein
MDSMQRDAAMSVRERLRRRNVPFSPLRHLQRRQPGEERDEPESPVRTVFSAIVIASSIPTPSVASEAKPRYSSLLPAITMPRA